METKNLTLEETAALFDGKEAIDEIAGNGLGALSVHAEGTLEKHSTSEKDDTSDKDTAPNN